MDFILRFRKTLQTILASAATVTLIASGSNAAQAAIFTYNYTGVVTQLFGGGSQLPPGEDLNGTLVGDRVSGSYSYDDSLQALGYSREFVLLTEFTYRLQQSDGFISVATLDNFLGVRTNGIINLTTGFIQVGVRQSFSDPFIPGGIIYEQGNLDYFVQNTDIVSTFQPVLVTTAQSVPEPTATLALLAVALAPMFLRYRPLI